MKAVALLCGLLLLAGCAGGTPTAGLPDDDAGRCIARCEAAARNCKDGAITPPSCAGGHAACDGLADQGARQACLSRQAACGFDRLAPSCAVERSQCLQTCGR